MSHARSLGLTAAAGIVLLGALLLMLAPGGGASTANPSAPTGCKFAGKRFVGTTSQRKKLCFTLTSDGRRLREYAFDYRNTCGSGNLRTTIRNGLPVASNGTFSSTGASGNFFKGKITGRTATGTTRSKSQTFILGGLQTCDSGLVRWSARQASG